MANRHTQAAGGELARAEGQFDQWRRRRKRRGPIPDQLWQVAAEAAGVHGVHLTARQLRLNASSLRRRMHKLGQAEPSADPPCFVEFPLVAPNCVAECILEAEDQGGVKLRIHLKAGATEQAAALGRLLWRGES